MGKNCKIMNIKASYTDVRSVITVRWKVTLLFHTFENICADVVLLFKVILL